MTTDWTVVVGASAAADDVRGRKRNKGKGIVKKIKKVISIGRVLKINFGRALTVVKKINNNITVNNNK